MAKKKKQKAAEPKPLKKKQLILLVGRTGSGKSAVAAALAKERNLKQVRSHTTRPMRPGEKQQMDHIFISSEDVAKYQNKMAAYTKIGDFEYFTTWKTLKKSDIYVIDPKGVHDLRQNLILSHREEQYDLRIFYLEIDEKTRKDRLKVRGDDAEVARKRIEAEDTQFSAFEAQMDEYNAIRIQNTGTLSDTVDKIINVLDKEKYQEYEFAVIREPQQCIAVKKNGEYLFKAKTMKAAKAAIDAANAV